RGSMIRTHGLTHVALAVRDPERSFRFYEHVFGMVAVYRQGGFLQAQTPGSRDGLVFERARKNVGASGGVTHFGFRLMDPRDSADVARLVNEAGGVVTRRGEFCPGEPYVFFRDLDGYEVEVWFELPTPVDPIAGNAARPRKAANSRE